MKNEAWSNPTWSVCVASPRWGGRLLLGMVCLLLATTAAMASDLQVDIELEWVAGGFSSPVAVRHAGDSSDRLFVVEQDGRILVIEEGEVLPDPFLDIVSLVESSGNEQGLLGLAFHPSYEANGHFFVNYTYAPSAEGPDVTRVSRFQVSPEDPDRADHASEKVVLEFEQDFSNHNGGDLHFGPDGYLYIATGDGGRGGDPNNRAQNLGTMLGKLLRIDVDDGDPYGIPPDNPFADQGSALPEIWAYGLRNPWRISFDRLTGDLFLGDVGQNSKEEINFQSAASFGGENYGWSCMEGDETPGFNPCDGAPLTAPILVYDHGLGCSVTGGFRYRGAITSMFGLYVFGDFCSGRIWFAAETSGTWLAEEWSDTDLRISAFGEDEDGELYVVDFGTGEIFRFVAPAKPTLRREAGRRVRPTGSFKEDGDSGSRGSVQPPSATDASARPSPGARSQSGAQPGP